MKIEPAKAPGCVNTWHGSDEDLVNDFDKNVGSETEDGSMEPIACGGLREKLRDLQAARDEIQEDITALEKALRILDGDS